MIRGDRIFGSVMMVLALGYILSATQIETSFLSDPVGPRIFPYIVAAIVILCSLSMILRPDPEAAWPGGSMVLQLGIALAALVGYAHAIGPFGFIIPTAAVAAVLSWQIGGRPVQAVSSGAGLSLGLFVLFKVVLGLGLQGLPAGLGG